MCSGEQRPEESFLSGALAEGRSEGFGAETPRSAFLCSPGRGRCSGSAAPDNPPALAAQLRLLDVPQPVGFWVRRPNSAPVFTPGKKKRILVESSRWMSLR